MRYVKWPPGAVTTIRRLRRTGLSASCHAYPNPPLAPDEPGDEGTVYIVLNDFGPLGQAYVETDAAEADDAAIVSKILNGEYSNPVRVVAYNTAKNWIHFVGPMTVSGVGANTIKQIVG